MSLLNPPPHSPAHAQIPSIHQKVKKAAIEYKRARLIFRICQNIFTTEFSSKTTSITM